MRRSTEFRRRMHATYGVLVGDDETANPWAAYLKRYVEGPDAPWSVAGLARESGVSRAQIFRWKGGKVDNVTVESVRAIGEAVGDMEGAIAAVRGLLLNEDPFVDDADTSRAMTTLLRRLRDPNTSAAQKAIIKGALTELAALPESAPSEQSRAETA